MRKNISLFFILVILSIGMVSAANAISMSPISSTSISGTVSINTTLDSNTLQITNVTFYYRNDTSGSWIEIGTVNNITSNQTSFNTTWDSTAVVDGNNYELNASMINITGDLLTSDVAISMILDNGLPTASYGSSSVATNTYVATTDSFTLAIAADSTIGISNCTFTINGVDVIVPTSSNACSSSLTAFSNFSISKIEDYTYTLTATDGNGNTTTTSSRILRMKNPTGGGDSGSTTNIFNQGTKTEIKEVVSVAKEGFFKGMSNKISDFFKGIGDFFRRMIPGGN